MNLETNLPFTLHTMLPRHTLTLSRFTTTDLLCDRLLKDRTVMVQDSCEVDFDVFFNLLDEVNIIIIVISLPSKLFTYFLSRKEQVGIVPSTCWLALIFSGCCACMHGIWKIYNYNNNYGGGLGRCGSYIIGMHQRTLSGAFFGGNYLSKG